MADEKIEVENINCPGQVTRLDAKKYHAMKKVLLKVLPKKKPGVNSGSDATCDFAPPASGYLAERRKI